ncbi:MAG: bifunctional phosphopantothenoylcysteine decarboxylase/phosphopantothenate--cysteine ligase CoaBC [Acidimicrobiales bacterium]
MSDGPGSNRADGSATAGASLLGATVVLGVSGGIAAYKAVELCRRLVDAGAHVVPVLTANATRFVGAATFSALASEPARLELFGDDSPIPHTELGRRADLVLVAPATARVIGAYAAGISSDLLVATLLATRAPVLVCPAMHSEMWEHAAVQENLATLRRRGVHVLEPESGRLAGGDLGAGRLPETGVILEQAARILAASRHTGGRARPLSGRHVLVTAGGTREPIDPVRFLSNRSSGKQGHALAEAAAELGADVTLVTTSGLPVASGVEVVEVETAAQMAEAVLERAGTAELVVMAAAVADYRPAEVATSKLRKADGPPEIRLVPTVDILAELGRRRHAGQVLVGFAAETGSPDERAKCKLEEKNVDLMVANDVEAEGVGFAHETNAVTIFHRGGGRTEVPLQSKKGVAEAVLHAAMALLSGTPPCKDGSAGQVLTAGSPGSEASAPHAAAGSDRE